MSLVVDQDLSKILVLADKPHLDLTAIISNCFTCIHH